jgi:hypothetical protein
MRSDDLSQIDTWIKEVGVRDAKSCLNGAGTLVRKEGRREMTRKICTRSWNWIGIPGRDVRSLEKHWWKCLTTYNLLICQQDARLRATALFIMLSGFFQGIQRRRLARGTALRGYNEGLLDAASMPSLRTLILYGSLPTYLHRQPKPTMNCNEFCSNVITGSNSLSRGRF